VLKDKLDSLGVECHFHYGRTRDTQAEFDFLEKHLAPPQKGVQKNP